MQVRQKGKRIKLRAGRDLKELNRDQAFLDSGALGGNFISPEFAEKLKDKGFKIEKLDSLCSIATPDGINNLNAHSVINFKIKGEKGKEKTGEKGKDKTIPFDRCNDKRNENPNSQSSSSSKSSKMSHSEKRVTHKDTDTTKPLCPACGAYSSDKHNPHLNKDSCFGLEI